MGRSPGAAHAEIVLDVLVGGGACSEVSASWRRSGLLHALDPANRVPSHRVPQSEIDAARERLGRLLKVAQGIGTCIVEKRPLTVDRDQHFFTRNSLLFCTTAPIFDEHGVLAAALDVSSCRADLTKGFSRLIATAVIDAARAIEAENFRCAFPNARILLAPRSERAVNSLIAVDRDDLVIGATRAARRALSLDPAALAHPLPAADLIGEACNKADDMIAAERAVLQRALARAGGKVSRAARDLDMSRATLHRKLKQLGLHR
jgi:transcriptional regulator of acetoin/glycerol metabolism